MTVYYFDICDRDPMRDDTGTELATSRDARVQAVQLAGRLLAEEPEKFLGGDEWHMEVRGADGLVLFSFAFVATDPPCTTPSSLSLGLRRRPGGRRGRNRAN